MEKVSPNGDAAAKTRRSERFLGLERTPSSVRLATFCSSAMYSDCTELAMPRELTCTARVCATHTSEGPAGAPLQLSGEAIGKAVGTGRGHAGAQALLAVGRDGRLKEGKTRTNGLNAPALIILGAKVDAPGQTDQPRRALRCSGAWHALGAGSELD